MNAEDLAYGLQYSFQEWFVWCSFIKSIFFAFIIPVYLLISVTR